MEEEDVTVLTVGCVDVLGGGSIGSGGASVDRKITSESVLIMSRNFLYDMVLTECKLKPNKELI